MARQERSRRIVKEDGPDPIDVFVGMRIRTRRKSLGISQGALAEALGLSFQQVQKYERGINRVSASMLVRTAAYLNCPVAYFVDQEAFDSLPDNGAEQMMTPGAAELLKTYSAISAPRRAALLGLMRSMTSDGDE